MVKNKEYAIILLQNPGVGAEHPPLGIDIWAWSSSRDVFYHKDEARDEPPKKFIHGRAVMILDCQKRTSETYLLAITSL